MLMFWLTLLPIAVKANQAWHGLGFDHPDFACYKFPIWCKNAMEEIGCTNSTIVGCPNYPEQPEDLPNFVGKCICNAPVYYDPPSNRVAQELVTDRISPDIKWLMEPWSSGPPYNIQESYLSACSILLDRLGCPGDNKQMIAGSEPIDKAGVLSANFTCACGKFTASTYILSALMIDYMNSYDTTTSPIFSDPVYLSVSISIAITFIVGKLCAITAVYLKLPPIIGFLLGGFAIQNILNPMFLKGAGYPYPAPASEMKNIALIIVLMRAGLSIKFEEIWANLVPTVCLSVIPYFCEFTCILFSGRAKLPGWSYIDLGLFSSIMAPLGPSIVISTMLLLMGTKKDYGYTPAQTIICAPIEAVIAIILFGIFANLEQTTIPPLYPWVKILPMWLNCLLIPVNLLFSAILGIVIGAIVSKYIHYRVKVKSDYIWVRVSKNPQMGASTGDLVFVFLVGCYTFFNLCTQQYIQQCTGVLVVFSCAITVSIMAPPQIAADLAQGLKGIWIFAEVMLFTLTGCSLSFDHSNGPLYGQRGLSNEQMNNVVGMIFSGLAGRSVGIGLSMLIIYWYLPPHRKNITAYVLPFWLVMLIFAIPKATVQATMGSVAYTTQIIPPPTGTNKGLFIAQATAFTVLICAPIGTILIKAIGAPIAEKLAAMDKEAGWKFRENRYSHSSKYYEENKRFRSNSVTVLGSALEMITTLGNKQETTNGTIPHVPSLESLPTDEEDEYDNSAASFVGRSNKNNQDQLQDEPNIYDAFTRARSATHEVIESMVQSKSDSIHSIGLGIRRMSMGAHHMLVATSTHDKSLHSNNFANAATNNANTNANENITASNSSSSNSDGGSVVVNTVDVEGNTF